MGSSILIFRKQNKKKSEGERQRDRKKKQVLVQNDQFKTDAMLQI